jgi:non-ribosomal peptide synthetase component F
MAYDFNAIVRAATSGLPEDKHAQVHLALAVAAFYGILERLNGNTTYVGPGSRLEPIYTQQLGKLRQVSAVEASRDAKNEDVPSQGERPRE